MSPRVSMAQRAKESLGTRFVAVVVGCVVMGSVLVHWVAVDFAHTEWPHDGLLAVLFLFGGALAFPWRVARLAQAVATVLRAVPSGILGIFRKGK